MKKIIIFVAIFIMALFLASTLIGATLEKSMIPADTQWLLHFNIDKFKTTSLHDLLLDKLEDSKMDKDYLKFKKRFKIDLLNDISGVTVFGKNGDEKNTIILILGKFDREHLLGLLDFSDDHEEISYGKHIIHNWDRDEYGTFINDNLVMISHSERRAKEVLDTISGKSKNFNSSQLASHLKGIPGDAFLSASVADISSMTLGTKPRILKKAGMGLFMAMEKQKNLNISLTVEAESPEIAENLEQIIKGFIAMGNLYEIETLKDAKLIEALKITRNNNRIKLEISYPTEKLASFLSGEHEFGDIFHMLGM